MAVSIVDEFTPHYLEAMRKLSEEESEAMLARLLTLSFVDQNGSDRYSMHARHRKILQAEFISKNRDGFIQLHQKAASYWMENSLRYPQEYMQRWVFHGLMAGANEEDPTEVAGLAALLRTFQTLTNRRNLFLIESLLAVAASARPLLAHLDIAWLGYFDDVMSLLQARLAQLEEDWDTCAERLKAILGRKDVTPEIAPYVMRTHGDWLVQQRDFAGAIDIYKKTLERIDKEIVQRKLVYHVGREWEVLEAERAMTMIALGDAHFGLAKEKRGDHRTRMTNRKRGVVGRWLAALASLPIIIFLSFYFGIRVFRPRFWIAIGGEDWMILKLMGVAYHWYEKGKPTLIRYTSPKEQVMAFERQADLFLALGDWPRSIELYEMLRREEIAPLSDYHHGVIGIGLAESYLRMRQPGRAYGLLIEILPVFERFTDLHAQIQTKALLGEAGLQIGKYQEAISNLAMSVRGFEAQQDWVSATNLVEYIQLTIKKLPVDDLIRVRAQSLIDSLLKRAYPVHFIHPGLNRLWLSFMAGTAFFFLILPLTIVNISETIGVVLQIGFQPEMLFDLDLNFAANIQSGLTESIALGSLLSTNIDLRVAEALLLSAGFFLLLLIFGLIFIQFTPIRSIQESEIGEMVLLDETGIAHIQHGNKIEIKWTEVTDLVSAGLSIFPKLNVYASSFGVLSEKKRIVVRAQTDWYRSLHRRIFNSIKAPQTRLDHILLLDPWLPVYLLGAGFQIIFMISAYFAHDSVTKEFYGFSYRLVDMYPYFSVLLLVPPLSWLITIRWRHRYLLRPHSFWPFSLLISGGVITIVQILTTFRPLLTIPDIYLPMIAIATTIGGFTFIWWAKDQNRPVYSLLIKGFTLLVALVILGVNGYRIGRDVSAYHYLVQAKSVHRSATNQSDAAVAAGYYTLARDNYVRAYYIVNLPVDFLGEESAIEIGLGLPQVENMVAVQALQGIAATSAELDGYRVAISNYEKVDRLLDETGFEALVQSWIAAIKESEEWSIRRGEYLYDDALLAEFNGPATYADAVALNADWSEIYFNQGAAYHIRGDLGSAFAAYDQALNASPLFQFRPVAQARAYLGLAWVRFESGQYASAMLLFERAIQILEKADDQESRAVAPILADAYTGLGYTAYQIGQYDLAERAFLNVLSVRDGEPDLRTSVALATVNWRLGIHSVQPLVGQDVCALEQIDVEAKRRARRYYWAAIDHLDTALNADVLTDGTEAELYRTRAGIHLLLGNCPEEVFDSQIRLGIFILSQAIQLDTEKTGAYYLLRANYRKIRWENRTLYTGSESVDFRQVLLDAYADVEQAIALEPLDARALDLKREIEARDRPILW